MPNFTNASDLFLNKPAQVFLKAAQSKSFTETAEYFGLTQSAVSRIIAQWEEQWKIPLFNRNNRPLKLTPEGLILEQELEKYTASFSNLAENLRKENELKLVVKIGCIESMSVDLLPSLIIQLKNKVRQLISVIGTSNSLYEKLLKGDLDIILSSDSSADLSSLRRKKIFQEGSLLVLPKSMENSECWKSWSAMQFCGLPFIKYHHATGGGKLNDIFVNTSSILLTHQLEVDSNSTMMALVSQGIGWTLSRPSTLLQNKGFLDKVIYRPMPSPVLIRKVYVLSRRSDPENVMNDFVDTACDILKNKILGQLIRIAPWMEKEIFVYDPRRKVLVNGSGDTLEDV